jgi:hypothetical protein
MDQKLSAGQDGVVYKLPDGFDHKPHLLLGTCRPGPDPMASANCRVDSTLEPVS